MARSWLRSLTILVGLNFLFAVAPALPAQDRNPPSPWKRPKSSKALFESLGIKLDEIKDHVEAAEKNLELYLRILIRLQQLPKGLTFEWAKDLPELRFIEAEPGNFRGEMFKLDGNLRGLDRVDLPQELSERFGVKALYKLTIALPGSVPPKDNPYLAEERIEIWTANLPNDIKAFTPELGSLELGRFAAEAVFLSIVTQAPHEKNRGHLSFCACQISWYPDRALKEPRVSRSLAALGRADFDVGLLDSVKNEPAKRLTPAVTEPFLQLLTAEARLDWPSIEPKPLDLAKLVSQPNDFTGEAIEFDAIARRVVEVAIDDPADRKRLGLDRYYQVDLVLPKSIRTLVKGEDGVLKEVEQENFPLTICTAAPPFGLPLGQEIREPIHAKAFFFKLWAYESKFAQSQSPGALQVSPLFVAAAVERAPSPEVSVASSIWLVGGAIGFLACIALWGYLVLKGDDQKERRLKRSKPSTPGSPPPPLAT